MRCEITAALLHNPKILFLDEPTIGLDLNAKLHVRELLNRFCNETKATLFLTSHDMVDIEKITDRVLVLNKGCLVEDEPISNLKKKYGAKKVLTLITEKDGNTLKVPSCARLIEAKENSISLEVDAAESLLEKVIHSLMQQTSVKDISIEEPSLEDSIRAIYGSK